MSHPDPAAVPESTQVSGAERDGGLPVATLAMLTAAAFLVFVQAFMIAPLLPRLGQVFGTSTEVVGWAVPAYLVPYGVMTLLWGPVSDRFGRRRVILSSLVLFVALTAATAAANDAAAFILLRLATAIGASGIVPVGLALIGDLVPFRQRGRALGWVFGGMAGGTAVGSTIGALLEPVISWRGLFLLVALCAATLIVAAGALPHLPRPAQRPGPGAVARGYLAVLAHGRARRTYGYVLVNAVLHGGVYAWLGLYLQQRFGLGSAGIGLALLGYGIPGFLLGPVVGRWADRYGRARLIPLGLAVGAASVLALAADVPLPVVVALATLLSLDYDLTQPLLGGIVTDLPGHKGPAMGLNVCTLFAGFGLGSLLFQAGLAWGFTGALVAFGSGALVAAGWAVPAFAAERAARRAGAGG